MFTHDNFFNCLNVNENTIMVSIYLWLHKQTLLHYSLQGRNQSKQEIKISNFKFFTINANKNNLCSQSSVNISVKFYFVNVNEQNLIILGNEIRSLCTLHFLSYILNAQISKCWVWFHKILQNCKSFFLQVVS